jgi:hypothetical protein
MAKRRKHSARRHPRIIRATAVDARPPIVTAGRERASLRAPSMTKKPTSPPRKHRETKYFNLHESNSNGMDNAYWVYKKRKGYYLSSGEEGELGGPSNTISEALGCDLRQYGGEYAEIDTNVQLEELFDIMNMYSFEPLLHNLCNLNLNEIEIDAQSFKNFVTWYAECCKRSAAKRD